MLCLLRNHSATTLHVLTCKKVVDPAPEQISITSTLYSCRLFVYRKGDLVKDPMKSRDVVSKNVPGVGYVMQGWGGNIKSTITICSLYHMVINWNYWGSKFNYKCLIWPLARSPWRLDLASGDKSFVPTGPTDV